MPLLHFYCVRLIEIRYCTIHDLVVDCLQRHSDSQQIDPQHIQALNQTLVRNYWQFWQEKQLQDDSYFYHHFIDHAEIAQDDGILHNFMTDLNWIIAKIAVCKTLTSLLRDLRQYMQCIHIENKQVSYDIYSYHGSIYIYGK